MRESLSRTVFLVSGGARGITAECVIALAQSQGGSYILVGRTPIDPQPMFEVGESEDVIRRQIAATLVERGEKATPVAVERVLKGVRAREEIVRTLDRIERAGARACYVAADVTDGAAMREAVAAAGFGPVTGIIHGAGTLADKRIEAKSDQDLASVYSTKVHGLRAMLSAVDESALSHLALFSSTSGFYGNVGQSDYAAANEVLNKFAHAFQQRYPACNTVVFDWGPWDGGMVTPFLKSLFESRGVSVMPVETGAQAFVDVLASGRAPVQLLVNDIGAPESGPTLPGATPVRRSQPALRVSRVLGVEGNPFLRDHVISGHPVLPAASAGLWMANVCQQSNPTYRFTSLSDFRVLKGVVFDGTGAERYFVEVKDVESSVDGIVQSVFVTSTTRDQKARYHYRGTVRLSSSPPSPPEPRHFDLTADPRYASLAPYVDGSLFHGPTFQTIARVLRIGPKQISVECAYPPAPAHVHGKFPPVAFDAVALDTQFQCLGLWAHHVLGASALPTSWSRYESFAPPPADGRYFVTAEIQGKSDYEVKASIYMHDAEGGIFAQALGVELTVHRAVKLIAAATEAPQPEQEQRPVSVLTVATEAQPTQAKVAYESRAVARALREVQDPAFVLQAGERIGVTRHRGRGEDARRRGELLAELPALPPSRFGAASFRREYGVDAAYMAGAMAKGIASEELVIALGRAGFLGTFGAGGLSIPRIEQAVVRIQEALPNQAYAFNLLHSPRKLATEDATVDVYLKHGVHTVEASSYIDLTPSIVRYRVAGLHRRPDDTIEARHRVIVKLSRLELASRFMLPPPGKLVHALLEEGRITREQADLAMHVPMADDVTFEADSGGHTDNRPLVSILPAALALRDEIQREQRFPVAVRIGAAGGIATPQAVLAAFTMGADYVVTGSINQSCIEAGTSDYVKQLLCKVEMTDVAMAPESDLFEQGGRVQVVKQGSLYPMRAQKLFSCYQAYESLEAIPESVRKQLETQVFRDSLEKIWESAERHLAANKPEELTRAADPKVKMALLFKWYMGQSSRWAAEGTPGRELDYQVWCGPGMGAFNAWARGTYLESPENRRVADVARVLMSEAAYLHRVQQLRLGGLSEALVSEAAA